MRYRPQTSKRATLAWHTEHKNGKFTGLFTQLVALIVSEYTETYLVVRVNNKMLVNFRFLLAESNHTVICEKRLKMLSSFLCQNRTRKEILLSSNAIGTFTNATNVSLTIKHSFVEK